MWTVRGTYLVSPNSFSQGFPSKGGLSQVGFSRSGCWVRDWSEGCIWGVDTCGRKSVWQRAKLNWNAGQTSHGSSGVSVFHQSCPSGSWNGQAFISLLQSVLGCGPPLEGHGLGWGGSPPLRQTLTKLATRGPLLTAFPAAGTTVSLLKGIWASHLHVHCKSFCYSGSQDMPQVSHTSSR